MTHRVCTDCKRKLPIIKFPIMNKRTGRRRSYCGPCWHEYMGVKKPKVTEWRGDEAEHIKRGRITSQSLTEGKVRELLLERIGYYFDWPKSSTLDGWLEGVAHAGGTFGEFYGSYDTGARTTPYIEVKLRDGRAFRFSKADLYKNRAIQMALL